MSSAHLVDLDAAVEAAPASHLEAALALLLELRQHDPEGELGADAARLARAVAGRLLDDSARWSAALGACYDVDGVRELLGAPGRPISKQAVSQRVGLLALTTGSGRVVYPAFQFSGRAVVDGLPEVLRILPATLVSRWTVASWLVSHDADLSAAPVEALRQGRVGAVVASARDWAGRLAA